MDGETLLSIGWDFEYSTNKYFLQPKKGEKWETEAPVTHN